MGNRQHHKNGPADLCLKSPHTWSTSNSCKKIFAFLSVQKSLGTRVIPKQKQFKQPIWEEDEEGRKEGDLFHLLHCESFLHHPRLCNIARQGLWSVSSSRKGTFISAAAVCALRCLRWKGHSHRLQSTSVWPVYTHLWLSRVMMKGG